MNVASFVDGLASRQREKTPMPVELDDDERIFVGALDSVIVPASVISKFNRRLKGGIICVPADGVAADGVAGPESG
jgi:hypothetical protein